MLILTNTFIVIACVLIWFEVRESRESFWFTDCLVGKLIRLSVMIRTEAPVGVYILAAQYFLNLNFAHLSRENSRERKASLESSEWAELTGASKRIFQFQLSRCMRLVAFDLV